jgi:hypothetical protein
VTGAQDQGDGNADKGGDGGNGVASVVIGVRFDGLAVNLFSNF